MSFTVPERELQFRTSRAGGPGGQHVNRASTRVEVLWNVTESPSLSTRERELILEKLASRIDSNGILRVVSDRTRSQVQNKVAGVERMNSLVQHALHEPPPRKKTKPPRSAVERRLEQKRRRSQTKQERQRPELDD
jgi:ribosome-associated protein